MRKIESRRISKVVSELCVKANLFLRPDILTLLKEAYRKEKNPRAKKILKAIIENASTAKNERLALCQDTGLPCVFVELGQNAKVSGDLKEAINKGIEDGYKKGYFRNSVVANPLLRSASRYTPGIIHIDIVKGNKLKLTVLPKGFGCENKTQLRMFNPTVDASEIKKFVVEAVRSAGADACPPYVVGVGIGGTADYACFLAKKALLRKIARHASHVTGHTSKLEHDLLEEINRLNIGPMGLGGRTTALAVNIETYPTHIAGLPVCVNISCHALRSADAVA